MEIKINMSNKVFYTLIIVIAIILIGVVVYAYNSGQSPSVFGHSASEIEGVCRSDGTGCPSLGGGGTIKVDYTNCVDSLDVGSGEAYCPTDYVLVGGKRCGGGYCSGLRFLKCCKLKST